LRIATEHMVRAIEEITLNQGIDPRTSVLVGGGGAAGLNAVAIARRLGCQRVIIPDVGAALSAAGALASDLTADYAATFRTTSAAFDHAGVAAVLEQLQDKCHRFITGAGAGAAQSGIDLFAEMRYPREIWELEVPLRSGLRSSADDVEQLRQDFHTAHAEVFGISDSQSAVEMVGWRARAWCRLGTGEMGRLADAGPHGESAVRPAYFPGVGLQDTVVRHFAAMAPGIPLAGPAIIESPVTTVVIDPGAVVERTGTGSLSIRLQGDADGVSTRASEEMVR